MQKKIKVHLINIDHWFESKQDMELYRRVMFPNFIPQTPPLKQSEPPTLWIEEAITYLGLDRTGIKRPDKAIHRLINKGALHPKKISGRLCFDRRELDRVLANGDHKQGRGRPRKK
ncbi:MAG: helix-turn-helix domain-containing protein [Planctomycetes bacterium]|nr:helix-turn-helix domain-containing protein [Planctomycetota bacterium]